MTTRSIGGRSGSTRRARGSDWLVALAMLSLAGYLSAQSVLYVAWPDIGSLDPLQLSSPSDVELSRLLHETLVSIDDAGNVGPALATRYATDDGRVWTFWLRHPVYFHSGRVVTANAVEQNLERARQLLEASAQSELESIAVVDDGTIRLTFDSPVPELPLLLARPAFAIVDRADAEEEPEGASTGLVVTPAGTGPMRYFDLSPGRQLILGRNGAYWDEGDEGADYVVFELIAESSERSLSLLGGHVDLAFDLDVDDVQIIQADPDVRLIMEATDTLTWLGVNLDDPVLEDPRIRRALAYGVDRSTVAPPEDAVPGVDVGLEPRVRDVAPRLGSELLLDRERARALLAAAGHQDGLVLDIIVPDTAPFEAEFVQALEQSWNEIGVSLNVTRVDRDVWLESADRGALGVATSQGLWVDQATPRLGDNGTVLGDLGCAGVGSNRYCNLELEAMLRMARATPDIERRLELYRDAYDLLQREVPRIALPSARPFAAASSAVGPVEAGTGAANAVLSALSQRLFDSFAPWPSAWAMIEQRYLIDTEAPATPMLEVDARITGALRAAGHSDMLYVSLDESDGFIIWTAFERVDESSYSAIDHRFHPEPKSACKASRPGWFSQMRECLNELLELVGVGEQELLRARAFVFRVSNEDLRFGDTPGTMGSLAASLEEGAQPQLAKLRDRDYAFDADRHMVHVLVYDFRVTRAGERLIRGALSPEQYLERTCTADGEARHCFWPLLVGEQE